MKAKTRGLRTKLAELTLTDAERQKREDKKFDAHRRRAKWEPDKNGDLTNTTQEKDDPAARRQLADLYKELRDGCKAWLEANEAGDQFGTLTVAGKEAVILGVVRGGYLTYGDPCYILNNGRMVGIQPEALKYDKPGLGVPDKMPGELKTKTLDFDYRVYPGTDPHLALMACQQFKAECAAWRPGKKKHADMRAAVQSSKEAGMREEHRASRRHVYKLWQEYAKELWTTERRKPRLRQFYAENSSSLDGWTIEAVDAAIRAAREEDRRRPK
jgi:hypothetical protein